MAYEFITIKNAEGSNIQGYLEEGWEVHLQYIESEIEHITVKEEVPQVSYSYSSGSSGYGYNNYSSNRSYFEKVYPVAVHKTVFILKRGPTGKVLYGKNTNT